jgi:hypothetical protein
MRDWVLITLAAVLALGVGYWFLRDRSRRAPSGYPTPVSSSTKSLEEALASAAADSQAGYRAGTGYGNGLAVLEFEGEPGCVTVMRPEVVIGRHTEDDIQVRDVRVSRHHARLVARRDGSFEIHNLTAVRSEPNPMQVNGVTREHANLQDGDIISLGGVNFTLWLKAA